MSDLAQGPKEPVIREISAELVRLRDRVEDLEDARELPRSCVTVTNRSSVGNKLRTRSVCDVS